VFFTLDENDNASTVTLTLHRKLYFPTNMYLFVCEAQSLSGGDRCGM
jgi:hypothetical protein